MNPAIFFWLVPGLYMLFALAFALVGWHPLGTKGARWASAGFMAGCIGSIIDTQRAHMPMLEPMATPAHWAAIYCLLKSMLVRREADLPSRLLLLWLAVSVTEHTLLYAVWPSYAGRVMALNALVPILISLALPGLWRGPRTAIDSAIATIVTLCGVSYVARLAVFVMAHQAEHLGGPNYWNSYNLIFYLMVATMGVFTALAIMLATGADLISAHQRANTVDALTGVGNRRAVDNWMEAERGDSYGAVLMIDLDHFKRVNDTFGHAAGDEVLRAVALTLKATLGDFADLARMGGEEFVALVRAENVAAAGQLALAIRSAVEAIRFEGSLAQLRITASVGLAVRTPDLALTDLIKRADMATYQAKSAGRNVAMQANYSNGLIVLGKVA